MGENYSGFCSWVTSFKGWIQFHLGDSGQVNQISSFLPVKATHSVAKLAKLYIKHIVCLHGVPVSIISDRGSVLPLGFGRSRRKQWAPDLISWLLFILRQMVNLRERSKLEEMLRMYIMDLADSWNDHLPLVEFSYNNSYHSNIEMALYETL